MRDGLVVREFLPTGLLMRLWKEFGKCIDGDGLSEVLSGTFDHANPVLRAVFAKQFVQDQKQSPEPGVLRLSVYARVPDGSVYFRVPRFHIRVTPQPTGLQVILGVSQVQNHAPKDSRILS